MKKRKTDYDEYEQYILSVMRLVVLHGFHCVNNMNIFSLSFTRAFRFWCERYAFMRGAFVYSSGDEDHDGCVHKASIGLRLPHLNVVKLRGARWIHVAHVRWDYNESEDDLPLQLACTLVVAKPCEGTETLLCVPSPVSLYAQVMFVDNRKMVDDIQTVELSGTQVWVGHSRRNDEIFEFLVNMRIAPAAAGESSE